MECLATDIQIVHQYELELTIKENSNFLKLRKTNSFIEVSYDRLTENWKGDSYDINGNKILEESYFAYFNFETLKTNNILITCSSQEIKDAYYLILNKNKSFFINLLVGINPKIVLDSIKYQLYDIFEGKYSFQNVNLDSIYAATKIPEQYFHLYIENINSVNHISLHDLIRAVQFATKFNIDSLTLEAAKSISMFDNEILTSKNVLLQIIKIANSKVETINYRSYLYSRSRLIQKDKFPDIIEDIYAFSFFAKWLNQKQQTTYYADLIAYNQIYIKQIYDIYNCLNYTNNFYSIKVVENIEEVKLNQVSFPKRPSIIFLAWKNNYRIENSRTITIFLDNYELLDSFGKIDKDFYLFLIEWILEKNVYDSIKQVSNNKK